MKMILSFHPCYTGDRNRLCAGRDPDETDRRLMRAAKAVILPQGCRKTLFEAARASCPRVFPDYTARFAWPDKTGQARLFSQLGVAHPKTAVFDRVADFRPRFGPDRLPAGLCFPVVFKANGAGEGDNVWRAGDPKDLERLLVQAAQWEATGQHGFILQQYVETGGRSLRVAVVGKRVVSYWRLQPATGDFRASASRGAVIDHNSDPELRAAAEDQVNRFCAKTGINLAGFDLLFSRDAPSAAPLFLEINYFFGRRGLGGSEVFYALLCNEIDRWVAEAG